MPTDRTINLQVDYDELAPTYNQRFKHERSTGTVSSLVALSAEIGARTGLEVGCGTGHWLTELCLNAGNTLQLFGLDLSAGMLTQARQQRVPLRLARGRAECIPFAKQSLDLIYCVNAIHHFSYPRAFIESAKQTLRPGGALAVIFMDPRGHKQDWYVYNYFPGTFERDLVRFPSWGMLTDWLIAAGFERLRLEPAEIIHNPRTGLAVFQDTFLQKNATSQLALLSQQEYEAGLQRIHQAILSAETTGTEIIFNSNMYFYCLAAFLAREGP